MSGNTHTILLYHNPLEKSTIFCKSESSKLQNRHIFPAKKAALMSRLSGISKLDQASSSGSISERYFTLT